MTDEEKTEEIAPVAITEEVEATEEVTTPEVAVEDNTAE